MQKKQKLSCIQSALEYNGIDSKVSFGIRRLLGYVKHGLYLTQFNVKSATV